MRGRVLTVVAGFDVPVAAFGRRVRFAGAWATASTAAGVGAGVAAGAGADRDVSHAGVNSIA